MIELIKGDCLEEMDKLIERGVKVDAIITDPPYGTTACKWDSVIPFNKHIMVRIGKKEVPMYENEWVMRETETSYKSIHQCYEEFQEYCQEGMWDKLNKLIKSNGAIVLFGSEPFSSALRMSNIKNYKYDWVWQKSTVTGHLNAKKRPMVCHELLSVFYQKQSAYYPQKTTGHPRKVSTAKHKRNSKRTDLYSQHNLTTYDSTERYPRSVLNFATDKQKSAYHSTQKPVSLMEYLIKTYTQEGETVLDFTMGSGSTGVACLNTNRHFIGIELDDEYFQIAKERIEALM